MATDELPSHLPKELVQFFKVVETLDRMSEEVESRINQYHRG
jgi:hypothetical protein